MVCADAGVFNIYLISCGSDYVYQNMVDHSFFKFSELELKSLQETATKKQVFTLQRNVNYICSKLSSVGN